MNMKKTTHKILVTLRAENQVNVIVAKLSLVRRSLLLIFLMAGYVGLLAVPQAAQRMLGLPKASLDSAVKPIAPVALQSGKTPAQIALEAARLKLEQARQAYSLNPSKATIVALRASQSDYDRAVAARIAEIRARLSQIFGASGFNRKGVGTRARPAETLLAEARTLTAELRSYDQPVTAQARPAACPTNETYTQSSSQAITPSNSISCNNGSSHLDNSYWRAFNLLALGITGSLDVSAVEIGVESAVAGSGGVQPITVRIYQQATGSFPGGTRTQLSAVNFNVPDSASGTVISVPITATISAGGTMVIEVFTPDGQAAGHSFFIGSNAAGATGPTFLSAPECGVTNPTNLADIGFSDMHVVMNVVGCVGPGEPPPPPPPTPTTCGVTTASYSGPAAVIPDNNSTGVSIVIPVSGISSVGDLNFRFDTRGDCDATEGNTDAALDHTWVGDLTFKLTSPMGTTVTFIDHIGSVVEESGNSGNNFCLTTLDDEGGFPAIEDYAGEPVAGDFSPNNPFSAFDGENPTGNWTLTVIDDVEGDTGNLRAFSLIIYEACPCSIVCPTNVTISNTAGQCGSIVNYPVPTTTGYCGTVTCSPASGTFFAVGATTVTCNTTGAPMPTCSFIVTVNDTQAPVVTPPANMTVANTVGQCGAIVTYPNATVTDNCSGAMVSCLPASGTMFAVGTTTVTCTGVDASPNSTDGTATFTVTVQDAEAPVLAACPANITSPSLPNGSPTAVTYTPPTATDNCGTATVACTPASGSSFAVGTTAVTCTATDAALNTATCLFNVTVTSFTPAPTANLVDPLACAGPGDLVNGSFGLTNTSAVNQTGTVVSTLPASIVGLPGTCVANVGTCTVTAGAVTWTGTLTPGQTLTASYQAQLADNAVQASTVCAVTVATFGTQSATVQACLTINCPQAGPGLLPGGQNAVSDQKPGSVLVYPLYSSSASNAATQNTRISITNTNPNRNAYVHLFFVDGSSCSVADSYICLTPNQTASLLASDVDPGTTGYLVAVAVNPAGCPINFNHLIGDEFVKLASGHQSNLGAESIAAVAGGLAACNPLTDNNAVLAFNNVSYNALPRVLASSNIPSRGNGNDTYVVINRIGGNLSIAGAAIGGFFGILYDDAEAAYSFSLAASACQSAGSITNDRPRTVPRIETVIPSGRSGWFKVWGASDIGILGAQINRNASAATNAGAFNHGHNLHKLTYTTSATITIPVFPPSC